MVPTEMPFPLWHRALQSFRLLLVFLVTFGHFPTWHFCEASTVSATHSGVHWQHRRDELQQRFASGLRLAYDAIIGENNKCDFSDDEITGESIGIAGYRSDYAGEDDTLVPQEDLKYGQGQSFNFQRFQSSASIRKALRLVRTSSSFKWFEGKDGRKGYISSTKLGGDYVLAESEQIAVNCSTEDVLRAYLSEKLQTKWNSKNCLECHITKFKKNNNHPAKFFNYRARSQKNRDTVDENFQTKKLKSRNHQAHSDRYFYLQDLLLKSQRVIRSQTGPMRYQQIIEIDKIGQHDYTILVRLLKNKKDRKKAFDSQLENQDDLDKVINSTAKKPFESLEVYVGLEQVENDVKIYAAGVFEVNRKVVPKLIVFDTSGFAGSLAGKGTLWLAGYFEKASMKLHETPTRK